MTIFQKIINKEIKADVIFENQDVIAIKDINPVRKGHFLVIPKTKSINLMDIKSEDLCKLIKVARKIALSEIKKLGVKGFKLIINNGKSAGQEVFHTHIHIIPM